MRGLHSKGRKKCLQHYVGIARVRLRPLGPNDSHISHPQKGKDIRLTLSLLCLCTAWNELGSPSTQQWMLSSKEHALHTNIRPSRTSSQLPQRELLSALLSQSQLPQSSLKPQSPFPKQNTSPFPSRGGDHLIQHWHHHFLVTIPSKLGQTASIFTPFILPDRRTIWAQGFIPTHPQTHFCRDFRAYFLRQGCCTNPGNTDVPCLSLPPAGTQTLQGMHPSP